MKQRSDCGVYRFSDQEMIERHSIPEPNSGCWLWLGDINTWGYGRLSKNRAERLAHRVSYLTYVGTIPSSLKVLHSCDVPCCVNPQHLFLGTDADNMQDMAAKGRGSGRCGESNPQAKLTAAAAEAIRASAGALSISALSRRYGVSRRAIGFVLGGRTWAR